MHSLNIQTLAEIPRSRSLNNVCHLFLDGNFRCPIRPFDHSPQSRAVGIDDRAGDKREMASGHLNLGTIDRGQRAQQIPLMPWITMINVEIGTQYLVGPEIRQMLTQITLCTTHHFDQGRIAINDFAIRVSHHYIRRSSIQGHLDTLHGIGSFAVSIAAHLEVRLHPVQSPHQLGDLIPAARIQLIVESSGRHRFRQTNRIPQGMGDASGKYVSESSNRQRNQNGQSNHRLGRGRKQGLSRSVSRLGRLTVILAQGLGRFCSLGIGWAGYFCINLGPLIVVPGLQGLLSCSHPLLEESFLCLLIRLRQGQFLCVQGTQLIACPQLLKGCVLAIHFPQMIGNRMIVMRSLTTAGIMQQPSGNL